MTNSPVQGVLSEVPNGPLRDPRRDPKTSQNLSGLLPLLLLPLNLSPMKDKVRGLKVCLGGRSSSVLLLFSRVLWDILVGSHWMSAARDKLVHTVEFEIIT